MEVWLEGPTYSCEMIFWKDFQAFYFFLLQWQSEVPDLNLHSLLTEGSKKLQANIVDSYQISKMQSDLYLHLS